MKKTKLILASVLVLLTAAELIFIFVKFILLFPVLIKFSWAAAVIPVLAGMAIAFLRNDFKSGADEAIKKPLIAVSVVFVVLAIAAAVPFSAVENLFTSNSGPFAKLKSVNGIKINDEIKFGHYNGSDIEWTVLDIKKGKALVISKEGIDAKPFNEEDEYVNWEDSSIRAWLNDEFYKETFSSSEQEKISTTALVNNGNSEYGVDSSPDTEDKIFLLSADEAEQYFSSEESRICRPAAYAENSGYTDVGTGTCYWWLRSPGYSSRLAAVISVDGFLDVEGKEVNDAERYVRPAMWVEL